eukprot:13482-Heterococcus_DN1.PRE.1
MRLQSKIWGEVQFGDFAAEVHDSLICELVDVEQGYKHVLNAITKQLKLPTNVFGYKLYNISKTDIPKITSLKDNDLVLISRDAYFKVPQGSSIVINTTPYAGFYPNKIQHNNNEAAVQLLFGDEFDDSIEAQATNGSTATIKGMLIYDEHDELIAIAIRDSGTGMDVAELKAALIPHLSTAERGDTSAAAADTASSDKSVFRTNATGRVAHFGIGGNTTANSYGKHSCDATSYTSVLAYQHTSVYNFVCHVHATVSGSDTSCTTLVMPYTDTYYCCTNVYLGTAAMLCVGRRVTIVTKSGPASMLQAQINFADLVRQREEDGAYSAQVHTRRP